MNISQKAAAAAAVVLVIFSMAVFSPVVNASLAAEVPAAIPAAAPMAEEAPAKSILVFGDSLSAGYGLAANESFPAQLEARLKKEGLNIRVINAGVSGETTAGGLRRLNYSLKSKPDYIILELGANDMLRATDPVSTRENLRHMLDILKTYDRPVLLAGMRAFPNMGPDYAMAYLKMYKDLADGYHTAYYPFFLDGVVGQTQLNQADGVHPTAEGIGIIVEKILPTVADLLVMPPPSTTLQKK